jgi:hypothetical protein
MALMTNEQSESKLYLTARGVRAWWELSTPEQRITVLTKARADLLAGSPLGPKARWALYKASAP